MKHLAAWRRRAAGAAALTVELGFAAAGFARPQVVLLLGHMRSGSSLLLHLLLTHTEFASLGECNRPYESRADLARLAVAARLAGGAWPRPVRYVVDQVNHNRMTPTARLLCEQRVRVVFLLREPSAAIASLLEISRNLYGDSWSVATACAYLVDRLDGLVGIADAIGDTATAAFIRYETLVAAPEATLAALQEFFGLPTGFSPAYRTHAFTGVRGDPGPLIKTGRVQSARTASPIAYGPELERVMNAHQRCCSALSRFALPP